MAEQHTRGAVEASNQITGCQKVTAGGLSLAGMRNIIDRVVSQPLQARIDRLEAEKKQEVIAFAIAEAEKAELVEELKAITGSWDAIENKEVRSLREWEIDSRERSRALIAKAEPS